MTELDDFTQRRLETLIELVTRITAGDLEARLPISSARDSLDAVVVGMNMLAEELAAERSRRRVAEDLLRDAIEGYENAPGLFCSVDLDGVVLQCNETMARWLGRSRQDLKGVKLLSIYADARRDLVAEAIESLLEGRPLPVRDHELTGVDGRLMHTLLSGSVVVDDEGRPTRVRFIYRDVTEERRLETQLLQSQKMEGLGRLAGGIAHDFNNLLMAIFSSAESLRELVTTSDARDEVEVLQEAAQRASELTSHLLTFSRRSVVAPVPTDVDGILANMERLLNRTLGKSVQIVTRRAPSTWTAMVDPTRLEQVVMNLAVNARDAMPSGGRIWLSTENVVLEDGDVSARLGIAPGSYVVVRVSDEGVGMPDEVLDHLFEPFFTTKGPNKGTGLGLATAYGIARQAGGTIDVHSELGRGSRFDVYLPRSESSASAPRPAMRDGVRPTGGSETILLVEDDAAVRSLVARALDRGGYIVHVAEDGQAALEAMRRRGRAVELVVTDSVLPGLGGRRLIDVLRSEGLATKAILMSGFAGETVRSDFDRDSNFAFLQKPFSSPVLLNCVRCLLDAR